MEIFVLLVGFCTLFFILQRWFIFNNSSSISRQRYQQRNLVSKQQKKTLKSPNRATDSLQPTEPKLPTFDQSTKVVERRVAAKQLSRTSRIKNRTRTSKHKQNVHHSYLLVQQFRKEASLAKLPAAIATLRRLDPYVFEELLLTCCEDQGWQIERSFRYSGDGGVDGRVLIAGFRYLVQAKRYKDYINPQHIEKFRMVIQSEGAAGGFFIHTGKTRTLSKQLLTEFRITLISGQKLIDFVLGRKVRIVGITIPISSDAKADF